MNAAKTNHISLSFDAISENEAFARMTAAMFMAQLNPTLDDVEDVKTAVSEAGTNAIIHGYEMGDDNIPSGQADHQAAEEKSCPQVHMNCSYIGRERSLAGESIYIILIDTAVALLAGFIIFPTCFAFGVDPGAGPGLIFVSLPNIFNAHYKTQSM